MPSRDKSAPAAATLQQVFSMLCPAISIDALPDGLLVEIFGHLKLAER